MKGKRPDLEPPFPAGQEHPYTENFCEENIWHLGRNLCPPRDPGGFAALVLVGRQMGLPVFAQRKGGLTEPVWWDYHVILQDREKNLIYDFDSRLPFPCTQEEYVSKTFAPAGVWPVSWQPLVRAVPLPTFLHRFDSDRSHMIDGRGRPLSPFPPWPPILCQTSPLTLANLRNPEALIPGVPDCRIWSEYFP